MPHCTDCKQPLVSDDEPHTYDACVRWNTARDDMIAALAASPNWIGINLAAWELVAPIFDGAGDA